MIVSLIGLPGSGKSSVGRRLAAHLSLAFVDLDAVIEARLGCTIRSYFERHGEDAFRDAEQEELKQLLHGGAAVLATGGGAVLRPINRQRLAQRSRVVYLNARPDSLVARLQRDRTRPLLQVPNLRARLDELFAQRDPLYREIAWRTVDADAGPPGHLAREIANDLDPR